MENISIGNAKSRFSELISRAAAGERFTIQRRERTVAVLISPDYLERLERSAEMANRLAAALGQDADLIKAIELGEVNPVMAAFGLWKDAELDGIMEDITANRHTPSQRPEVEL